MWALLVIDRYSPGDISSGLFSALFVVVILWLMNIICLIYN